MKPTTFVCLLSSLAYLRCSSADPGSSQGPLVALFGATAVGSCTSENGVLSVRGINATSIGNNSINLQDALDRLSSSELNFSHYTICLRGGETYAITSPVKTSHSLCMMGASEAGSERDLDDAPVVNCSYNSIEVNHTLYFNRSDEVRIEYVQVQGCPYPFGLESVRDVHLSNCSFRFFTQSVLDIFNCIHTVITNSAFHHNTGTGISREKSRGNTGAVAFGFRDPPEDIDAHKVMLEISHTEFINNSAFASSSLSPSLDTGLFPGRGGALGIFLTYNFDNISIVISDCYFLANSAQVFGGAINCIVNGDNVEDNVYIRDTIFDSNVGEGGSGVQLSYIANSPRSFTPVLYHITNCVFRNHTANAGGALSLFPSYGGRGSKVIVINSTFVGNQENTSYPFAYGSAIAISEINLFDDRSTLPKHEIIDCTFVNNSGENGIFNDGYAPVRFLGTNRFIGNKGTPLKIVGALVDFTGTMQFINNSVAGSAALYFTSFSQARVSEGLQMLFEGNVGRIGASLFVDNPTVLINNGGQLYNPLCFLLHENLTTPPPHWHNITITTTRNRALEGSSLYIRTLESCAWTKFTPPFFNLTSMTDWPIWDIREDNENTGFMGDVKTDAQTLIVTTLQVSAWPMQRFPVTVSVYDQFDLSTTVTAQHQYSSNLNSSGEQVLLQPDIEVIASKEQFTQNFSFVTGSLPIEGTVIISDGLQSKAFQNKVNLDSFGLHSQPCPGGYTLSMIYTQGNLWGCVCDDDIDQLLLCKEDQDTIVIQHGYWAVHAPSSSPNLHFYPCPAGYCSCFPDDSSNRDDEIQCMYMYTNSDHDAQCECHRGGTLCGECTNHSSVTALFSRCSNCTDVSVLVIPALVILDVVVFTVLMLLNIPLPDWTYPFFFYVQLAPYVAEYFPESFETIGKYVYFIGSASSFYYVYDFCIYNGMSALAGFTMRYLPLLLAALTVPPVMFFKMYTARRRSTVEYHGLWWVVLLMYSHVVYTSMTLLNCPSISGETAPKYRWFMNGEVQCFTGTHIPLGLLAILSLVCALILIALTAGITLPWRGCAKPHWINSFSTPLTASFRVECQWWASVELARRALFLLLFLLFPRDTVAPILVLSIILAVYGYAQPYKSRTANLLEIVTLTNFILLLLLRETPDVVDTYFRFPGADHDIHTHGDCMHMPDGISYISWILFPFYYIPVLLFSVALTVYATLSIRNLIMKIKRRNQDISLDQSYADQLSQVFRFNPLTTRQSLRMRGRGETHGTLDVRGQSVASTRSGFESNYTTVI